MSLPHFWFCYNYQSDSKMSIRDRETISIMEHRSLGPEGLKVSCIGLGCMGMSWAYGQPDDQESVKTIQRAIDLGINFFDTAEVYGPFKNEELLGKALKGRREKVIIATKFGFMIEDGMIKGANSRPDNVRKVADESLKRLGTNYIDLFYQHRVDPAVPIEETVAAMAELVKAGKVRYLGLSEAGADTIRRAHSVHPISALQSEYSLWERGLEVRILPTIRELGIGLVAYCPVGRGILTGKLRSPEDIPEGDYRRSDPRYCEENFQKNMELVELVIEVATIHGASAAQVALAWLLEKGSDIVPIPGTKRVKFLEENTGAAGLKLTQEDMQELDRLAGKTCGERYEQARMKMIER
jgi:aryl-alcohol dehydrogenase-like predicted oxidoreductase